jgi:hypothetical protein
MTVLIDGHNLIGQMPDIHLDDPDDEEQLLLRLRTYQARTGKQLEVYFDPGLTYQSPARQSWPGITVHQAGSGQRADDLMIQAILRHGNPRELVIVTSDRAVQQVARQRRARVLDSARFVIELHQAPRRKVRRARRPAAGSDPMLSPQEVQEWISVFKGSARH